MLYRYSMRQPLTWAVGHTDHPDRSPAQFVPAQVPGNVQCDWARAAGWPAHDLGDNWKSYTWMEDRFWIYRAQAPAGWLVLGGVDYRCEVRLDGRVLHRQEGMFTPIEIELAQPGLVEVVVHPAPKSSPDAKGHLQADACTKPPVSYGWDFHPRLIPLGIWDAAWVEVRPANRLEQAEIAYQLSGCLTRARLQLEARLQGQGRLRWRIADPDGDCVLETDATEAELSGIRLWWPNGQGEPDLYRWTCDLLAEDGSVLDSRSGRVGFRSIRLIPYPGAWDEPATFPKSRSLPPIQIEVNGRPVFAKGSNWVPPDIFTGTITEERYRTLVGLAHGAHFNILRVWGGGGMPHQAFFDACDELGIMVWQEFPLACLRYSESPEYLAVLEQEARSIITRLRQRACLVLWCGGNELFNGWSRNTDQSPAIRLLNHLTWTLDAGRPFIPAAPIEGMGHGDYRFRDEDGRECFNVIAEARCTAYSEFGCGGVSPLATLKRVIPADQLWPPKTGTAWQSHGGIGAWDGKPDTWAGMQTVTHYFGTPPNLETLVEQGQFLQAQGFRLQYEEARRQAPRCAMALSWCFTEPWATAANNSIIAWPDVPKPALDAIRLACRPTLASAKVERFLWKAGDEFAIELWLLHDAPEERPEAVVTAWLETAGARIDLGTWTAAAGNGNLRGPTLRTRLPAQLNGSFLLRLTVSGQAMAGSDYRLIAR